MHMILFTALKRGIYACIASQFRRDGMVHGVRDSALHLKSALGRKVFVSELPFGVLSYMHHESQVRIAAGI